MTEVPSSIRRMAHDREFKVTLRIGRSGLTDAMFDELDAQLSSRKVVKVKMMVVVFYLESQYLLEAGVKNLIQLIELETLFS